jgi:UDP-N-acetylglucosamine:LPS N-acetylglucosamine transferase
MKRKTKVGIFTTVEGHLSICEAVESYLPSDTFEVVRYFERDQLWNFYIPVYHVFPHIVKAPFELVKFSKIKKMVAEIFRRRYDEKLTTFFEEEKPDLVISTVYIFNPTLEILCKQHNVPFLNMVADPRSIFPLEISAYAENFVFDKEVVKVAQKFVPNASCTVSGWLVRPDFVPIDDKKALKKKLGLNPEKPVFFVASGSEGSVLVMKILPALFSVTKSVTVIVACGSNETLRRSVNVLAKYLNKDEEHPLLMALPFTPDISRYMQSADLVVGKAGPNTLFESVALHIPFLAISHIAGQETGNLDIIRQYKLGWVEENPVKAIRLLTKLAQDPGQLAQWSRSLQKLATHNRKAPEILHKKIDAILHSSQEKSL